jgi:hypothetical protein
VGRPKGSKNKTPEQKAAEAALPPAKTGRPAVLEYDPSVSETILSLLREGNFFETACRVAGVHPERVRKWVYQGARDVKKGDTSTAYAVFSLACAHAKATSEAHDVRRLSQHGDLDWRALAWRRERLDPAKFGPPKAEVDVSGQIRIELRYSGGIKPEDV